MTTPQLRQGTSAGDSTRLAHFTWRCDADDGSHHRGFPPNPTWAWNTAAVAQPCKIQTGLADRIPRFNVPKRRDTDKSAYLVQPHFPCDWSTLMRGCIRRGYHCNFDGQFATRPESQCFKTNMNGSNQQRTSWWSVNRIEHK